MTVFFSTTPHPSPQEEGTTGSVFPFIIHFDTPTLRWVFVVRCSVTNYTYLNRSV